MSVWRLVLHLGSDIIVGLDDDVRPRTHLETSWYTPVQLPRHTVIALAAGGQISLVMHPGHISPTWVACYCSTYYDRGPLLYTYIRAHNFYTIIMIFPKHITGTSFFNRAFWLLWRVRMLLWLTLLVVSCTYSGLLKLDDDANDCKKNQLFESSHKY